MPFQYAQTTYVNAVLSPDVYFVFFVINVYSVLYNMCVCQLFVNKESSLVKRTCSYALCRLRQSLYFVFTARRLAKRGICRRRVSVCLSVFVCVCVCHTPVLYQNG